MRADRLKRTGSRGSDESARGGMGHSGRDARCGAGCRAAWSMRASRGEAGAVPRSVAVSVRLRAHAEAAIPFSEGLRGRRPAGAGAAFGRRRAAVAVAFSGGTRGAGSSGRTAIAGCGANGSARLGCAGEVAGTSRGAGAGRRHGAECAGTGCIVGTGGIVGTGRIAGSSSAARSAGAGRERGAVAAGAGEFGFRAGRGWGDAGGVADDVGFGAGGFRGRD